MRSLFLAGLLALSTLAYAPHAAAEPGYTCDDGNLTEKVVDEGYLQVNLRRNCSLEFVFFEGLICVGGWGGVIEQDLDRHTLRVYYCTGGIGGPGGPIDLSDLVAPAVTGCAPTTKEVKDPLTGATHRVEVFHNCRSHITLNEGIICVGAWSTTDEHELGVTHVTHHRCTFPGGDPVVLAMTDTPADPCADSVRYYPGVTITSRSDCHQRVDIKFYDCVWNCGWATLVNTPLLTVRYYTQSTGEPMSASSAIDVPTPPWAPCTTLDQDIDKGAVRVEILRDCRVIVHVKLYECIWGGYWDEKTVGPVTVRDYKCGPATSAAGLQLLPGVAAAAAQPQCNGIWWHHSEHDVPLTGATVTLDTNLQPQCTTVRVERGDFDCTFDDNVAKPDCDEYVVEPWQCLGGASGHKDVATPVGVVLRVNICTPPGGTLPPIQ